MSLKVTNTYLLKWSFFIEPSLDGSGKNKKNLIFPTGLEVHLEDMF